MTALRPQTEHFLDALARQQAPFVEDAYDVRLPGDGSQQRLGAAILFVFGLLGLAFWWGVIASIARVLG